MTNIGYARVSTGHQTLDQQVDALIKAGVQAEHIYSDKMSGARDDRPGLRAALAYVREGDTLTVVALDRLGRSLSGIIATVEELSERKVALRSLREGVDFNTPMGKMIAGIFGSLAEYERTLINERAAAAREAARARGRQVGRPKKLDDDKLRQARALRDAGESVSAICTTLDVSRATLYRVLSAGHLPSLPTGTLRR
jgi:DNA invertase Pin-like site-specific DNA recombinase